MRADKGFDPVEVAARQVKREKAIEAAKAAAAAGVAAALTPLLTPPSALRVALPQSDPTPPHLFMALRHTKKATSIPPSGGWASAHRERRKHHAASSRAAAVPDPDDEASDGLASILQPLPRVLTVSVSQW